MTSEVGGGTGVPATAESVVSLDPVPARLCASPDEIASGAHPWPTAVLQIYHHGRWAYQLGMAWPEPVGPRTAPMLDLAPAMDLLGAFYDGCSCADGRLQQVAEDPVQAFCLVFSAYVGASGGGPAGIDLTATQLLVLFGSHGARVLVAFRNEGLATALRLVADLPNEHRWEAANMALTRFFSPFQAIGWPPTDEWIIAEHRRLELGDDTLRQQMGW